MGRHTSGQTNKIYIVSWETDEKLVATVAEPTLSDKRSHFVFDSEELEDISKKTISAEQIII